MAKSFLTDIQLNKNELLQAKIHNYATAIGLPTLAAGDEGVIAFAQDTNRTYVWDGTAWKIHGQVESVALDGGAASGITVDNTVPTAPAIAVDSVSSLTGAAGDANKVLQANGSGIITVAPDQLQVSGTPDSANDVINKAYADSIAAGITVRESVQTATTQDLTAESFGASGVTYAQAAGTLTQDVPADGAFGSLDTIAVAVGDKVLVKDQTEPRANGVYTLTTAGDGVSTAWVLTRLSDWDANGEIRGGDFVFIQEGATQGDTGWVISSDGTFDASGGHEITNATLASNDAITWSQFSGAGSLVGGDGIAVTGMTISVDLSTNGNGSGLEFDAGDSNKLQAKVDGTKIIIDGSGNLNVGTIDDTDISSTPTQLTVDPSTDNDGSASGTLGAGVYAETSIAKKVIADFQVLTAQTSYVITHNLGTKDVNVSVRRVSDDTQVVMDVTGTTTNTLTLGISNGSASQFNTEYFTVTIVG